MRIRKRFLSLSAAITATPSSDLHSGDHHQLVQHQQLHPNVNPHALYDNTQSQFSDPPNHCYHPIPPSSSDHTPQIGLQPSTWVSSGAGSDPNKTKKLESERKKLEILKTAHDTAGCRKESILCTEANSHDLVLKGWFDGDRLIPIKKRRGSFEKRHDNINQEDHNEMMMMIEGTLMKSKAKKNIDKYAAAAATNYPIKNKKINEKRGNVIMKGSRCSRVNGRGWRCSQQTLVGYSLCEHHLGKGRLRSMTTSVRGRAQNIALEKQAETTKESQPADDQAKTKIDPDDEFEDDDDDEELEFKDWDEVDESMSSSRKIVSKRRKLGVVKARSLSSLLSQIGSS